jgi:hypothetical protein
VTDGPGISCVGLEPAVERMIIDAARQALEALGMEADLSALEISADDLAGTEDAWLRPRPGPAGGLPALSIYCHPDVFGVPRPAANAAFPPRAVWESPDPAAADGHLTAAGFSRVRSDTFLHHQLLWARDVLRGDVRSVDVPASLAEGFAAAWAVTVDGRLSRLGLPGYGLAERRNRFSRLFSTAGVLMPGHWASFQELWDGEIARPRDVVGLVRRLPRLQPRARDQGRAAGEP